ncbi:MAG: hypothetical protein NTX40_02690 [Planctomycetota bacterium]|jgi:hypothetical protein|nr:hypothetical protein [Planctomycetota bacterium]
MMQRTLLLLGSVLLATVAAALGAEAPTAPAAAPAPPAAPGIIRLDPPELGFFSKQLDYHGIPIKAHEVVADEAR